MGWYGVGNERFREFLHVSCHSQMEYELPELIEQYSALLTNSLEPGAHHSSCFLPLTCNEQLTLNPVGHRIYVDILAFSLLSSQVFLISSDRNKTSSNKGKNTTKGLDEYSSRAKE